MSACERAEDRSAYLDDELSAEARSAFEAHRVGCAACAAALEEQRSLDAALSALPEIEPSPGFEARFWARVVREEQEGETSVGGRLARWLPGGLSGWRGIASGLGLAAAAAVALVLALRTPAEPELDPDWAVVADAEQYEMLEDADLELLQVMEILEAWDGQEI